MYLLSLKAMHVQQKNQFLHLNYMYKMNDYTLFLLFACLISASQTCAQKSILRNGGFEEHAELKCMNCQGIGQYGSLVYHWDNGGWHCALCDTDYKQNSEDKKGKVCPLDKVSPQSGKSMISMIYISRMNGVYNGVEGASHLSARTTESMRVGRLYEVSLWIYAQSGNRHDPDWGAATQTAPGTARRPPRWPSQ
jgi:hypothetical protein